jgi:iron(III) transport system substrate-binding protein
MMIMVVHMRKWILSITALLMGFSPLSAADLTIEQIAKLTGPDRQKILEEGAKKEGELLWVGSFNEDNAKPMLDLFVQRYPFIKVNRVRTDSTKALQRVLAEFRAKSSKTDLITSSAVVDLKKAGAIQAFKSPTLDAYPAEDYDPDGYWAPFVFYYFGLAAYNTDQVKAAMAPKTYEDLLNPQWKSHIVVNAGSSGMPFFITFLRMQWGDAKAISYLEKLSAQKVIGRTESSRTVFGMMISGEHKIMIHPFLSHVGEAARKGAPVDVTMVNPVPYTASPLMLNKLAPHPYASMLLIDFLLDKDAQSILRDAGYFPTHPDVTPAEAIAPYVPKTHGLKKFLVDETEMANMMPETMAIYQRLFE